VRQNFTVSGGSRTVGSVSFCLRRVSGTDPLTVRVETAAGAQVEQGTVAAAAVNTVDAAVWTTYTFAASRVLTNGAAYNLVFSAPGTSTYTMFSNRKGVPYNFPTTTYFNDGFAEHTTDGSTWLGMDQPGGITDSDISDLQFYFSRG
jgi:hypothetical protein